MEKGEFIASIKGDEYLHTVRRMEPDVTSVDHAGAMASIAISLRRIADALDALKKMAELR